MAGWLGLEKEGHILLLNSGWQFEYFALGQPLALRERPECGQRLVVGEHGAGLAADMAV
ncbi:MAG: hypothetical protein V5B40_10995 [Candidatus Accumulibacter meliphilus]|jgi:hypothetical protein|uniref:hypothetical protein n=1 Tax=Candidatus Accumulibacter meliphilus TaxID=2211374 RepID=UPI002FC2A542